MAAVPPAVVAVALAAELDLREGRTVVIERQLNPAHSPWWLWNVVQQPLAFLIFLVSAFAECNRLPFDLPEAEQELVGGYHTEYSALKFGMFYLGEYTHMVTTSFLMSILFFGGWHFPFIAEVGSPWFLKVLVFALKMSAFIFLYMLIRWTIPRFRFDQLMGLAWKVMMPLALVNLVVVLLVKQFEPLGPYSPASLLILVGTAAVALRMPQPPLKRPPTGDGRVRSAELTPV